MHSFVLFRVYSLERAQIRAPTLLDLAAEGVASPKGDGFCSFLYSYKLLYVIIIYLLYLLVWTVICKVISYIDH